jgi:hypothetical protein
MNLQEPVAYIGTNGELGWLQKPKVLYSEPIALFTHPPVKESLTTQQEPVMWQYREANDDGTWTAWIDSDQRLTEDKFMQVRPLYLHPSDAYEQGIQEGMKRERALWQMQAEGQKIEQPKPLFDVQICALMPYCHNEFDAEDFMKFARAIEAAHGIKE